jgi:hypothetical protein
LRESGFLRAEQVMKEMQISRQKAYKIIRQLNEELAGITFHRRDIILFSRMWDLRMKRQMMKDRSIDRIR